MSVSVITSLPVADSFRDAKPGRHIGGSPCFGSGPGLHFDPDDVHRVRPELLVSGPLSRVCPDGGPATPPRQRHKRQHPLISLDAVSHGGISRPCLRSNPIPTGWSKWRRGERRTAAGFTKTDFLPQRIRLCGRGHPNNHRNVFVSTPPLVPPIRSQFGWSQPGSGFFSTLLPLFLFRW